MPGPAGARGLREAPAALWGAGRWDAGVLPGGSPRSLLQDSPRLLPPGPDPTGEIRSGFWGAAYFAHDIGRGLAPRRGVDSAGGTWSLAGKLIHPERREGKTPRTQAAPRCKDVLLISHSALPWVLVPASSALVPLLCFDYS